MRLAQVREYVPATPTRSGWFPGITRLAFSDVATGICRSSANWAISGPASEVTAPPPATMTGRFDCTRRPTASRTRAGSGSGRGRVASEGFLDDDGKVGLSLGHEFSLQPRQFDVHRPRRPGRSRAKGLAELERQLLDRVDPRVVFRDRLEEGKMMNFLVGVAVPFGGAAAPR